MDDTTPFTIPPFDLRVSVDPKPAVPFGRFQVTECGRLFVCRAAGSAEDLFSQVLGEARRISGRIGGRLETYFPDGIEGCSVPVVGRYAYAFAGPTDGQPFKMDEAHAALVRAGYRGSEGLFLALLGAKPGTHVAAFKACPLLSDIDLVNARGPGEGILTSEDRHALSATRFLADTPPHLPMIWVGLNAINADYPPSATVVGFKPIA